MDAAGNSASAIVSNVNIDTKAPALTTLVTPPPNANGWNNAPATVTFVASDALSGVATVTAPVLLSVEGAGQIATGTAADEAGNITTAQARVDVDLTPPEGYFQFDPVTGDIAFFGRDELSGVPAAAIPPASVSPWRDREDRDHHNGPDADDGERRTYNTVDRAGNTTTVVALVRRTRHELAMSILSVQYGDRPVTELPANRETFEWAVARGRLTELEQDVRLGRREEDGRVGATFNLLRNQTVIKQSEPEPRTRRVRAGLALLRIATAGGKLTVRY